MPQLLSGWPISQSLFAVLLIQLASAATLHAQTTNLTRVADTSSPRATLKSFIDACNEIGSLVTAKKYVDRDEATEDYASASRMIDCLNTSQLPAFARRDRAGEAAVAIKEVLDRVELPAWNDMPGREEIEAAGGSGRYSQWRVPGTRLTIARVEQGPDKHEYLFTPGTVERAPSYFKSVSLAPYRTTGPATTPGLYHWYLSAPGDPWVASIVERLPERMRLGRTYGLSNWKWPGLLIVLLAAVVWTVLLYRFHMWVAPRAKARGPGAYALTALVPLAVILAPLCFQSVIRDYLTVRGAPLYMLDACVALVVTFTAIVATFVICNRLAELIIATPSINPQGLDAQLIRIGFRLLSLSLAVTIFLIGGQYLGIPVGTLLASAGIGGIALALGAQDALKTLFGTIMLLADKPFRVGERIVFKQYDGIVEDIGLRSTRLRLLNSHQVTIPNDELARTDVENIGRRQHIRRVANLRLPLTATRAQVETTLAIVRKELEGHEGLSLDFPPRVRLLDITEDAYVIRIIYWYHPAEYWDYLAFSERFNLAVLQGLEEQGISLATPLRITPTTLANTPAPLEVKVASPEIGKA